jgi:GT2 family glycosyltransferase
LTRNALADYNETKRWRPEFLVHVPRSSFFWVVDRILDSVLSNPRIIDQMFPSGTLRGECRKIITAGLHTARVKGIRNLWSDVLQEWKEKACYAKPDDHLTFLLHGNRRSASTRVPSVAIIIPVYNAPDCLKKCLLSVLKNTPREHQILIVDDCNTDNQVMEILATLPTERCTILRNERNLGFVKSVNRGITRIKDKHIIIMNQDVEVPPNWIERIMLPIVDDSRVASVTPFSNGSTFTSFPEFCRSNMPYLGLHVEELDFYFERYGGDPVDVPSGVGFCMAMNRKAIDEVGVFDEEVFGRGFCEENDWCMRAWKKGYRNVAISNLFVCHRFGASFKDEKDRLSRINLRKVQKRHPEYLPWCAEFVRKDPFSSLRGCIKAIIDSNVSAKNHVLYLDTYTGRDREVCPETLLNSSRNDLLFAAWNTQGNTWVFSSGDYTSHIQDDLFTDRFKMLCRIFHVDRVLINRSIIGLSSFMKSIQLCGVPYDYV